MNFTRQTIPTFSAAQEEPKQETAKQATVNIRIDANCSMLCDGEYIETEFQANKITKMNLPLGQHLLEFFDMDYPDIIVEQEVDWPEEGKSYLVIVKGLQEKIEAARQADEEKKRLEAEKKAKAEAERKAKEEAERKAKIEAERKAKEEAERKAKEEIERKAKAEAEQKAKAEAEKKAKEDAKYRRIVNGHECVDLGLSVCWATCNMGASSPEEVGDYFAWGETSPKKIFTEDNYTYFSGRKDRGACLRKVVPAGDITGGKHDAAAVRWGGGWRMPTKEEWAELWKKKRNYNLVKCGVEIVAYNRQTLILPQCENYWGHDTSMTKDKSSYYWTGNNRFREERYVRDIFSRAEGVAAVLNYDFIGGTWYVEGGCPIRPVLDKKYFK